MRGLVASLERPTQLAALDADGRCALMRAAARGQGKLLEVLLEADERLHAAADGSGGGHGRRAHAVDREGATALMLWLSSRPGADLAACTKLLLEAGSDTQALDRRGRCALLRVLMPPASRGAAAAGADAAPGGEATPGAPPPRTAEAGAAALAAAAGSPLQRPLQARQVTLKPGLAHAPHKGAAAEPTAEPAAGEGGAAEEGFVDVAASALSAEEWKARLEAVKLLLAPQDFPAAVAALERLPAREAAAAAAQQKRREQEGRGAEAEAQAQAAAEAAAKVAADAALAAESGIGGIGGGGGGGGGGGDAKAERAARAAAAMAVVSDERGECALALAAEIKEALADRGAGAAQLYETIMTALAPCGGLPKAGGFALVSAARSGRVAAVRALLGGSVKPPLARPSGAALSGLGCLLPFSQLEAAEVPP